jgi:Carbohydrate-selective porin, OprB family
MSNVFRQLLLALPLASAAALFVSVGAFAAPATTSQSAAGAAPKTGSTVDVTAPSTNLDSDVPAQFTSTETTPAAALVANNGGSEAAIQPKDWQYEALRNVQGKYNCNDNSLNGQAVSRDSFAAGLNSCLQSVEPILAKNPSSVSAQDLEVLRRLTQDFRAELSTLETRVEKIQQRTALAQSSQFSTTTKLKGEVIIGLNGVISGGTGDTTIGGTGSNATISNRARLLLESTFTGKDRLYTRVTAGNGGGYGTYKGNLPVIGNAGIPFLAEGSQTYTGGGNNAFGLDWLAYQFPLGNTSIYAAGYFGIHSDYADTHSPYFQDFSGGNGAISLLAEESPIYKIGGGTGVGVTIPLSSPGNTLVDSVNLSYFAGNGQVGGRGSANSPANDNGLFNGRASYLAQVNFKPSDKFDLGLTYVHGQHKGGAIYDWGGGVGVVGSAFANGGSFLGANLGYNYSNSYGVAAAYKASENLSINGYVSYTAANATGNFGGGTASFNTDILTYGVGVALPNVGQPGNLLGFFVGQSPSVTNINSIANGLGVAGTPFNTNSYHLESFYKYKLNDNISITPGLIYLTSPNQVKDSSALIGTIRTTFTF